MRSRASGDCAPRVRMLCRRSASLIRITRRSRSIASSILRKLSAAASWRSWNLSLSSLVTPSTSSATVSPNSEASWARSSGVSSMVSCRIAATRVSTSTFCSASTRATETGWVMSGSPDLRSCPAGPAAPPAQAPPPSPPRLAVLELELVELGAAVDRFGHGLAEFGGELGPIERRVLDGVVQDRRDQGLDVDVLLGQHPRHRDRMGDVRLAGLAQLPRVRRRAYRPGAPQQRPLLGGQVVRCEIGRAHV